MVFISRLGAVLMLAAFTLKGQSQIIDSLVNIGRYNLHFKIIKGKGVPILFESGAGNDGTIWKDLLQPLHDSLGATLITYDRAGFGQSGIDTTDINITAEIKGLEIGLRKLGFTDRFFLVAHSLGGNYAMTFTSRNKNNVIAGVFIDVLSPCFMNEDKARQVKDIFKDSLEVIKKQSLGFYYIVKNYENTSKVMREASLTLKMPLTILCADKPPFEGEETLRWKRCMKMFSTQLGNRKFVLVANAGHYIFVENRKLVIDEIISRYSQ